MKKGRITGYAGRMLRRLLWRLLPPAMPDLPAPAPEDPPEWTADDRGRLLQFLQGETGRKALLTLRWQEEHTKADACASHQKRRDWAAGYAVGYRAALGSLIVLTAAAPTPQQNEEPPEGSAAELRNRLTQG